VILASFFVFVSHFPLFFVVSCVLPACLGGGPCGPGARAGPLQGDGWLSGCGVDDLRQAAADHRRVARPAAARPPVAQGARHKPVSVCFLFFQCCFPFPFFHFFFFQSEQSKENDQEPLNKNRAWWHRKTPKPRVFLSPYLPGTHPVRQVAAKLLGISPCTVGTHVQKVTDAVQGTPEANKANKKK
jgi:hypothetical protein